MLDVEVVVFDGRLCMNERGWVCVLCLLADWLVLNKRMCVCVCVVFVI